MLDTEKHLYANNLLAATIHGSGANSHTLFNNTDHLTGVSATVNTTGNLEQLLEYSAYGEVRLDRKAGSFSERTKYAGHEYDSDTGLSYMQARYYDPGMGRFISEDPTAFTSPETFLTDPQQLNAYAYARNNPIGNLDPDGSASWQADVWRITKATAGKATGIVAGIGEGAYNLAAGTVNTIAHPIATAQAIGDAVTHPGEVADAFKNEASARIDAIADADKSFSSGFKAGRAMGKTAFEVCTAVCAPAASLGSESGATAEASNGVRVVGPTTSLIRVEAGTTSWGMKHILSGHLFSNPASGVSKFAQGMGEVEIRDLINEAQSIKGATLTQSYDKVKLVVDMGRIIGTGETGAETSMLNIFIKNGSVTTAFPK